MASWRLAAVMAMAFTGTAQSVAGPGARVTFLSPTDEFPAGGQLDAISRDGLVGAGFGSGGPALRAARWTEAGGLSGIGSLGGSGAEGRAWDTNADGSVVVGGSVTDAGTREPFRWTGGGGMVSLGGLPGATPGSDEAAFGASADGSVIVGVTASPTGGTEAFRWTTAGMVGLGQAVPGTTSAALGVSGDGSVIVGGMITPEGFSPFRWTESTGLIALGELPGGPPGFLSGSAYGVSADGRVVIGNGVGPDGNATAAIWTEEDLWTILPTPAGVGFTAPLGVDDDGTVIVGRGQSAAGSVALLYLEGLGTLLLQDYLVGRGATGLEGWILTEAFDVSGDGTVIVGSAFNPTTGETQGFYAVVPGAGPTAMVWLAMAWAARRRRS